MSTIQRITFEDRGQDFLWWEVDMETGRVVGCGPFQGSHWAGGRVSVDVKTLQIGSRPRYFSPTWGEDGAVLRYEIVEVGTAPIGGGVLQ